MPNSSIRQVRDNRPWVLYVHEARAAIEAMREPTIAMLDSGNDCFDGCSYPNKDGSPCATPAEHIYRDMIATALEPLSGIVSRETFT